MGTSDLAEPKCGRPRSYPDSVWNGSPVAAGFGCAAALRAQFSRGDVAHTVNFKVSARTHRGPQCPQQSGGGLVRAPGSEAARLGQEFRGKGKEQEVSFPA